MERKFVSFHSVPCFCRRYMEWKAKFLTIFFFHPFSLVRIWRKHDKKKVQQYRTFISLSQNPPLQHTASKLSVHISWVVYLSLRKVQCCRGSDFRVHTQLKELVVIRFTDLVTNKQNWWTSKEKKKSTPTIDSQLHAFPAIFPYLCQICQLLGYWNLLHSQIFFAFSSFLFL
jgi:hypothetical protein